MGNCRRKKINLDDIPMKKILSVIALACLVSCASQKQTNSTATKTPVTNASPSSTSANTKEGHTRTQKVELANEQTYVVGEVTSDNTYGYEQKNAIKVGGRNGSGPMNERRFLNALAGPNGEQITYRRRGSCCPFKTPNGMIDNTGMLDVYELTWEGQSKPVVLYLNMYDEGDLFIPVGFTAKK